MINQTCFYEMVFREEFENTAKACAALPGVPVKQIPLRNGHAAQYLSA